jgi:hypothetical protein
LFDVHVGEVTPGGEVVDNILMCIDEEPKQIAFFLVLIEKLGELRVGDSEAETCANKIVRY